MDISGIGQLVSLAKVARDMAQAHAMLKQCLMLVAECVFTPECLNTLEQLVM
jgi:hypothetical protein